MGPGLTAAQACHAATLAAQANPDIDWVGRTLVVCELDKLGLTKAAEKFSRLPFSLEPCYVWREPDRGDELTAIAVLSEKCPLKKARLYGRPSD